MACTFLCPYEFYSMKTRHEISIPEEIVLNKTYFIRSQKVMLDRDLSELYGVETKVLKSSVKIRIFAKIWQALMDNTEQLLAIEDIRQKTENSTKKIEIVFSYFDEWISNKENRKQENE